MNASSTLKNAITVVLVLLGAYALGLGIRTFRIHQAQPQLRPQVDSARTKTKVPAVTVPLPAVQPVALEDEPASPLDEDLVETPALEVSPDMAPVSEEVSEPSVAPSEPSLQPVQTVSNWRAIWADLALTEEEKMRLREGFKLARERWQNMSPAERGAEGARLRDMGIEWQLMSDEEKQEASQRMRDRVEDWRASGSLELPELSLD